MRKKELFNYVLNYFEQTMDATETELHFSNTFELLVAVVRRNVPTSASTKLRLTCLLTSLPLLLWQPQRPM